MKIMTFAWHGDVWEDAP